MYVATVAAIQHKILVGVIFTEYRIAQNFDDGKV